MLTRAFAFLGTVLTAASPKRRLYDPHFDVLLPQMYRLLHGKRPEELLRRAQPLPGMRILDVGGGTGRILQHFPKDTLRVVVDPSWNMLRAAPADQVDWDRVQGLAEHLPFPKGTFHRVLIVDALHHFLEVERGLAEVWRVLAPGGRIIIEEPDITHPLGRLLPWLERLLLMRSRFLTAEEIQTCFPQALHWTVERQGIRMWVIVEKPDETGHPSEGPHG